MLAGATFEYDLPETVHRPADADAAAAAAARSRGTRRWGARA